MKKRLITFCTVVLCLALSLVSFAACGPKNENKVITGSITELSGDFRRPAFVGGNPLASDLDLYNLSVGYETVAADKSGNYGWNKTVVQDHSEVVNADGTKTFIIELKQGLKFSDGSAITAKNYVVEPLVFSSEVVKGSEAYTKAGLSLVGYEAFNKATAPTAFSGIKLFKDNALKFSMTVAADYIPYFYDISYASFSPAPLKLWLGDNVEIKDDGEGAYLNDAFYAKTGTGDAAVYTQVAKVTEGRNDITAYPYSGPYTITSFDKSTKQATLKLNPEFLGMFDGQKPSIETIVYTLIVSKTQHDALKTGQVDILTNLTGGDDVRGGLAIVENDKKNFESKNYQRAGYGKLQFDCDFGPAMFTEVRQAVSYLLDKNEFAKQFTGGYGAVTDGPYSIDSWMYKKVKDNLDKNLNKYNYSLTSAKDVLKKGGWTFNADGSAYNEATGGVRYKKLTTAEATEYNIAYKSVENTDAGGEYKTVKVGADYYMPLVINWFSSEDNPVSDLLTTMLKNNKTTADAGLVIRKSVGSFPSLVDEITRSGKTWSGANKNGVPSYSMYNLATSFTSAVYDYSFNWSSDPAFFDYSVNKYYDPLDKDYSWAAHQKDDVLLPAGQEVGMDYMSMAMVYKAKTNDEYAQVWEKYIERWNYLCPDIPLYSNIYYDVFNAKIEGYAAGPYWSSARALIYCTVKNAK